jgi:iron(III) transport system substrate-binding protein
VPKNPIALLLGLVMLLTACSQAAPSPTAAPPAKSTDAAKPAPAASAAPASKPAASPAAAGASASPVASPAAAGGAGNAAAYQAVVDGARKEGKLVVWITTPNLEPTQRALMEAFKKRFDMPNLETEWLPIHQRDAAARLSAEAKAGVVNADVIGGSSTTSGQPLQEGLITDFDWVGTFSTQFPGIKEAADRVQDDYKGKTLAHWDIIYAMGYNTEAIKAEAVPADMEELADPKWAGKFAMNSQAGSPYNLLALQTSPDAVAEMTKKLLANKPVLKNGSPAVVSSVVNGEVPLAIAYTSGIEAQKAKGAPVAWKPYTKYTPVLPLDLYVPKGAPHPNLGRLFSAWLVTEGMALQEEQEFIGRATDPNSRAAATIAKEAGGAPLLFPRTSPQQKVVDEADAKMGPVFSAAQGR